MTTILNCTPHEVTILNPEGCEYDPRTRSYKGEHPEVLRVFKPSGICPRVQTKEVRMADIDGVQTIGVQYGEIENLPEHKIDTFLIVSALVATAGRKAGRDDLLIPAQLVRDESGRIVGCLALAIS